MRYCVASCINIWDEKTHSITSWDPDRRVRTPTVGAPGRGDARYFLFLTHLISRNGGQIQPIPYGCLGSAPSGIRDLVRES